MHRDLNALPLKLFTADVRLPKTSLKVVPRFWAASRETSIPKVAVGPPDDTSH